MTFSLSLPFVMLAASKVAFVPTVSSVFAVRCMSNPVASNMPLLTTLPLNVSAPLPHLIVPSLVMPPLKTDAPVPREIVPLFSTVFTEVNLSDTVRFPFKATVSVAFSVNESDCTEVSVEITGYLPLVTVPMEMSSEASPVVKSNPAGIKFQFSGSFHAVSVAPVHACSACS